MKHHMKKLTDLVSITAILCLASLSQADVISINFQGENGGTTGPDVTNTAGYVQVGNWNNATGTSGTLSNLDDDSGNNSGASVSWTTWNLWDLQNGDGNGGDEDLMSGYLDNFSVAAQTLTVSNVPYDAYNVFVYFNRGAATYTGITASDGSNTDTYYARDNGLSYAANGGYTISMDDNIGDGWTDANVIKFTGFTGSTLTIDDPAYPGVPGGSGNWKVYIQGIQIRALTYEIQNGSFENDAASTNFTLQSTGGSELGGGDARYAGHEWGYYTASDWSKDNRVWHVHEYQESFPDGDYAYIIDGAHSGEQDVLAQGGLYLEAGKLYRLTFAMWGGGFATQELDVRFTYGSADITDENSGTGVLVLDEKFTDGTDADYENVTVDFVPTVTDFDYALQFIGSSSTGDSGHIWIDNVQIEWLPSGTLIAIQ